MSNFDFLKHEFPDLWERATKAEQYALIDPVASCFNSRACLEIGVRWMFEHDDALQMPYQPKLADLMYDESFGQIIKPFGSLLNEIHLIRKVGNDAVHNGKINSNKSVHLLQCLFRFTGFISAYYGANTVRQPGRLEEALLPTGDELKKTKLELQKLQEQLAAFEQDKIAHHKALQEREEENHLLKATNQQERKQNKEKREERSAVASPPALPAPPSEAKTRALYIDAALREAGWNLLRDGRELEFEVEGMPVSTNRTGVGYVDYVLWSDNGLPLAVIEAKKTSVDARKGRHQASLYADCLEKKYGQRPLIYYTNGFEVYLWDDQFATDRLVSGYMNKDELQLSLNRRTVRTDLRTFQVNLEISGRGYQLEAIQRVAENFCVTHEGKLKQRNRKSLLIMATGSGKTRTSASIVDMLTKCNWAKRILFLADRNALVTQAKNAFKEYLPDLSCIDLTKEKENNATRLVFSTYPTIMNQIDKARNGDERHFGVGHFDLIIIDEAHRSVYQKYRAIFQYFDAMLLGLTATPKDEIDRNTYGLFDIEEKNPTFAYELQQAVDDRFLVPPKAISVPLQFMREGIRYADLSDDEKAEYEEKFGDPTKDEADDYISSEALNKWLFNTHTVDAVLEHLMTRGIKVDGGDKLGKTIIFAKNHRHAIYIEERFNKNYPQYSGEFCRVIDNQTVKAQDLLEKFVLDKEEKQPQIAISVDMMDTGVDAPRVVNLVFFKPVRSYAKFWQMIGRGTRLRPNLFGLDGDKSHFVIFDYCQNFEYFNVNKEGVEASKVYPLTQQIFLLKLQLLVQLRESENSEEREMAEYYTNQLHGEIESLDDQRFEVRQHLRYYEQYKQKEAWQSIGPIAFQEIEEHLLPLTIPETDDHVSARRFDVLMLNYQLALLGGKITVKYATRLSRSCSILKKKDNIPMVKAQMPMIERVLTEQFITSANVQDLEEVRTALRDLMQFLDAKDQPIVETHFKDYLDLESITELYIMGDRVKAMLPYVRRVERYIEEHKDQFVIRKIKNNEAITPEELQQLEGIFFNAEEVGSKEEYDKEGQGKPLARFIREMVGLEKEVVQNAFVDFINEYKLNAGQIRFMDLVIGYLSKNGVIDKKALFESPFKDLNDNGPLGLFDDAQVTKMINILDRINGNAGVG
ncbi:MAG: type I restriction enzyme R subunit [Roseivirga sp.]|jgi:type I restriction enzyme R subunit